MALDHAQLYKPEKKLRKLLKKISTEPTPEEVHELRTNIRRMEALLKALQLDSIGNEKKLLRAVNPVRRQAGKVRDMDVLTGFASSLHAGEEADCRVSLLEYLGVKRYRQARKLGKLVRAEKRSVRWRLKRCVAHLDKMIGDGKQPDIDARATTEAAATSLRLASELRDPPRLNAGNLHEYRKKVKELRYVLKFAKNSDGDLVNVLGEVKDAIGEWHDWLELESAANKVLDHGPGCGLMHEIRAIARDKFEHALSLTNRMRARYVAGDGNRKGRRKQKPGKARVTQPVLAATSRIAA